MGNCYGYLERRDNLMETMRGRNGSVHKLMQSQEYGDGGVRHRPILPPVERSEGSHRSSVQPFTPHNTESVHDVINIQRPAQLDLRLKTKKSDFNRLIRSHGAEVRRIKVLISSRELSELLRRNNGDGDGDIESFLLRKLQGEGRHSKRSRQSWRPSLSDIPEVISS